MSFDDKKFLDALEGGVFQAALRLAAEKAGGTLGRLWRAGGCLFATVFDADGKEVGRLSLDASPLWRPVESTEWSGWAGRLVPFVADIDRDEAMAMDDILALYRFRQHVIKGPPA